ncbi:MAG: VWA domain-containing protein [Acidobacteriia bacterium]|nr:VWA domain-containing protein [Terriglobia bacterium]
MFFSKGGSVSDTARGGNPWSEKLLCLKGVSEVCDHLSRDRSGKWWVLVSGRWPLLLMVLLLLPSWPLQSQQKPDISIEVKGVTLLATVRDKHGQIVRNLTQNDFLLEQDGHPQIIRYFMQETNLPLTLGLLVDTSMSQRRVLDQERRASYSFLDQVLHPEKDSAFVIHFDREVELLQDLTSSRQKLESALGLLEVPQPRQQSGSRSPAPRPGQRPGQGRSGMGRGVGTLLYDAVLLASNELMQKQQGRKALIILSDGVDMGSKTTLEQAIESAQRANTLVYSILFRDEEAYGRAGGFGGPGMGGGMGGHGGQGRRYPQESRPDGKTILERVSQETGARLFEVSKKESIDQIYTQIQEELRSQYSLGYTPEKADSGPGYHKVHLTTRQKDLVVQTRDGYYAER